MRFYSILHGAGTILLPRSNLPDHHTTRYVLLHLVRLRKTGTVSFFDHVLVRCLLLFFRRRRWCK